MDIKVRVSEKRKCPASIDFEAGGNIGQTKIQKLAVLSFGDKHTPDTDVEVLFTLSQLKKLYVIVYKAATEFEKERHYGNC